MISGEALGGRHGREVVSLGDLLKILDASNLVRLAGVLTEMHASAGPGTSLENVVDPALSNYFRKEIAGLLQLLHGAEMENSAERASQLDTLLRHGCYLGQAGSDAIQLHREVVSDLSRRSVLIFTKAEAALYSMWQAPWGGAVKEFSDSLSDMEAASKSLACDLGTACAFHCMRVVEIGLRALVKKVGTQQPTVGNPNWNHWLQPIESQLSPNNKHLRTAEWNANPQFYADTTTRLLGVRDAWRNPTMHVERAYQPDEAQEVLISSQMFMKRLSEKVSQ